MSSAGQGDDQKSRAEDCKALNLNADAVVDFYSELQKLVSSKGFPLILIQEDGDSIRWVTEGPAIPRGLRDQQKAHYLATSDIDLNELDLVNKFDGAITLQGSTKKEAERLATVEEWCRNHENHHSNRQIITIALISGASALIAAFGAAGLTVILTT